MQRLLHFQVYKSSLLTDSFWSNGQTGDYLFLGNFVYTVSITCHFVFVCENIIYRNTCNIFSVTMPSSNKIKLGFFQYVIVTVCIKAGLETNTWTWVRFLSKSSKLFNKTNWFSKTVRRKDRFVHIWFSGDTLRNMG